MNIRKLTATTAAIAILFTAMPQMASASVFGIIVVRGEQLYQTHVVNPRMEEESHWLDRTAQIIQNPHPAQGITPPATQPAAHIQF